MKTIKLYFCDFWPNFDYTKQSLVYKLLSDNYNIEVVDNVTKSTDLIIYSCFGEEHLRYNGVKKLYYSGENDYPNFNQCDYAITHIAFDNEKHIRVPLWVFYYYRRYQGQFIQNPNLDESYFDRKFCADVISNVDMSWPVRTKIIWQIDKYKTVDHGGKYSNNVGGPVGDKIEFLSNYKFSFALENSDVDGYITEKIFESYVANTIPIFVGNKYVTNDFNPKSFININDFTRFTNLVARIKEIDTNKDLYMEMLNAPRMATDSLYNDFCEKLESFLVNIIENGTVYNHMYGRIGYMNIWQRYI